MFARRSNPSVEKPIQRKSKFYVTGEVEAGRADWVDPNDPKKGIICREMLYFGPKEFEPEQPVEVNLAELPGIKFIPPKMEKNPTLSRLEFASLTRSAPSWDWKHEPQQIPA